jgi:hypothetical protein
MLTSSMFLDAKIWNDPTRSRVKKFCLMAIQAGQQTSVGNIKWIAFMPNTDGFIGITVTEEGEFLFFDGIPSSLEAHLRKANAEFKSVRSVSVGYDDSWIVVYQDGSITWPDAIPPALDAKLQAGHPCALEVCSDHHHCFVLRKSST